MRAFTVVFAAVFAAVGPDVIPETEAGAPLDDYPRRIGVDVEAYRFDLILSDDTDRIEGRATVAVRFTNNGVTELPLDLTGVRPDGSGMTVTAVHRDGSSLRYDHEGDVLRIALAEAGRAGERRDIVVEYGGTPGAGLRIGPNKYGERTFFSDNWPDRARHWLPTIDHPYDKASSEMVVTAPAHYQVVSNGLLVEETDRPDGTRITHWRQGVPIATWLYVLGVARFAVQHVDDFHGRPIQTWVYWQDRDAGFYDFAVPTKRAMAFYDDYVGPYAYEKLANITSPATGGGMEAATAIMYHESAVTGERAERWRNVIVHEVAHQWFGNAVTESDWDDVWLSEGFATYFTLLFIEHAYGRDEFEAGLVDAARAVFLQYRDDPDYRIVHDDLDDMSRVTTRATYQKGAWVLHMLRELVGDEAFRAGIRTYYATYMNGNASTTDFRRVMERASGVELEDFFRQWLRSGGNPRLEGWWVYDPEARAVRIELNQTQAAGPTFVFDLDVGIHAAAGARSSSDPGARSSSDPGAGPPSDAGASSSSVRTVRVEERFHRFVIPVRDRPTAVTLDPDHRVLFESVFGPRDD